MTATPPDDNGQHGQPDPSGQQPQQGHEQGQYGQQPPHGQPGPQYGQPRQYGQPGPGAPGPQYGQPGPGAPGPQYGQPGPNGGQQPPQYGAQPPQWGQQPYGYTPPQPMSPADQRLWATLVHIGGIFFTVVVPIVGYFVLRDRGEFIREHTRTSLNFHITIVIAYVVGAITSWLGIGVLIALAAWALTIIFGIMAAVAANRGQFYRYPLSIEFVKH
jgi:uncharacterized Tic20 family protein